jgi:RNA-binding protein YhbY
MFLPAYKTVVPHAMHSCYRWTSMTRSACLQPSHVQVPSRRRPWKSCSAASGAAEAGASATEASSDFLRCDVVLPEFSYQPQMTITEKKVHKATAEGLAKQNRLVKFQLGGQGFSVAFLTGCVDALLKHEVIRVKLGGFTKQELAAATQLLESTLDCLVVYQIGHTLTLYRQAGLPRPSNLPPLASAIPEQFEYEDEKVKRATHTKEEKELKLANKKAKAARDSAAAKKLPPQFQVL